MQRTLSAEEVLPCCLVIRSVNNQRIMMNRRSVDLCDATRQDVVDICSAIEQVFLFYEKGKTPYIYIINLLELLLQSARTRLCIIRLPLEGEQKILTAGEVRKKIVVFANFRNRHFYNSFCEKIALELNNNSAHFLSYELVKIPAGDENMYFCLPRIQTRTNDINIDHTRNPEAYSRIRQLLQTMFLEKSYWCTDLLAEIYECFTHIPHDSNLNCPDTCTVSKLHPKETVIHPFPQEIHATLQNKDLLLPISEWVDYVYQHAAESRLTSAAHHENDEDIIDYSNIFFFLRVNRPSENPETKNCDSFDVRIICPEQQRRELSLYYHRKPKHHCQWYDAGKCNIDGMPACEFEVHWNSLPEDAHSWHDDTIFEAYEPMWKALKGSESDTKKTSEDAFRNNSVIFERYARKESIHDNETGYVRIDPESKRDRLMACMRYRLLPAPDPDSPEEDQVPQIMFVPIYTGGAPFVLAATVVNAKRPDNQDIQMSEWRSAYRFAGMVLQFMSSRLKEAARKAYLNTAANIMEEFARRVSTSIDYDIIHSSLQQANQQLAVLAQAYPYQQILLKNIDQALAKSDYLVNHKERQEIEINAQKYAVFLKENHFWCHYAADKTFFTAKDVARKFRSAHGRVALIKRKILEDEVSKLYEQNFGKKPDDPATE